MPLFKAKNKKKTYSKHTPTSLMVEQDTSNIWIQVQVLSRNLNKNLTSLMVEQDIPNILI
jgi:hypothetical protein